MKRIFALVVLLFSLSLSGYAQNKTVEVSRYTISAVVPAEPTPTGVCAGVAIHCVILTWTPPTTNANGGALTGSLTYDVSRTTTSGSGYVKITTTPVSTSTFEDDNVVSGTTYFYVVVAYQTTSGTVSGASANSVQSSAILVPPVTPPNPPTGLTVKAQ